MAIDPDGVPEIAGRPPLTARQRIWIILTIGAVVVLVVAFSGLIGGHKKLIEPTTERFTKGMPYSGATEQPKPVAIVPPKSLPMPPKTVFAAIKSPSKADVALESKIFSTMGTGSDGGTNARQAALNNAKAEKDDEFTGAMTASSIGDPAKARRMKHPSLTIPAGIVIPCVLQTAINSELMGFVDCQLASEVRSADGTVTLLDKGTAVMGQIKSGLRRGQDRLFILWTRARTPENVTVDLASPAADELGRAGVDGYVNDHFWKMFWTAALFSLIDYGPQLGTAAIQNASKGANSFNNYTTFLQPQQQLANTVLQDDLHIPPTLEKNQGDIVSIFVARDLDFSSVYALTTK